jgi:hypothetical protein
MPPPGPVVKALNIARIILVFFFVDVVSVGTHRSERGM